MNRGLRRYIISTVRVGSGELHADGLAVVEASCILGIRPSQLMGTMRRETGGSFSPDQWGGYGRRFLGLIQFNPENQRHYGVRPGMTFREQLLGPVVRYLQDRFRQAGMSTHGATTAQIYAAILAGSPRRIHARDVNGSSHDAVPQIERWGREWSARYGITDDMVTRPHAELAALVPGGPRPPTPTLATAPPPAPAPLLLG